MAELRMRGLLAPRAVHFLGYMIAQFIKGVVYGLAILVLVGAMHACQAQPRQDVPYYRQVCDAQGQCWEQLPPGNGMTGGVVQCLKRGVPMRWRCYKLISPKDNLNE
jgi:hypothetical protein